MAVAVKFQRQKLARRAQKPQAKPLARRLSLPRRDLQVAAQVMRPSNPHKPAVVAEAWQHSRDP